MNSYLNDDVLLEIFSYTNVNDILNALKQNLGLSHVLTHNSIWKSLLASKPLRDLMFYSLSDMGANTLNFPIDDFDVAETAAFLWELFSDRKRPLLTKLNEKSFVSFMFVWTFLPHVYFDKKGKVNRISSTFVLANSKFVSYFAQLKPVMEVDDNEPYENYVKVWKEKEALFKMQLTKAIQMLTPMDFLGVQGDYTKQFELPYIHLDLSANNGLVVKSSKSAMLIPNIVLENAENGQSFLLRNGQFSHTGFFALPSYYLTFRFKKQGTAFRFSSVENTTGGITNKIPIFFLIGTTDNGTFDYAVGYYQTLIVAYDKKKKRYKEQEFGVYDHRVIENRKGRIAEKLFLGTVIP